MARLEETIQIEIDDKTKKDYKVYEMRVKDVLTLVSKADSETKSTDKDAEDIADIMGEVSKYIGLATDLTIEDAQELYPNDLMKIYEGIKRVNSVFFSIAEELNLLPAVIEIGREAVQKIKTQAVKNFLDNA